MTEKSWPFHEARSLLAHIESKGKTPGDLVTFETGYGPSGAPHIGTFGEVVRTLMVMNAFTTLTENAYPVRLLIFSDDYDAFRSVPEGLPESMKEHLGKPLSDVPDPAYEGMSFAQVNNSTLMHFVRKILRDRGLTSTATKAVEPVVEFRSATQVYRDGELNEVLERVWDNHQAILDILLPTFGDDRKATYCAFMPVHNGRILHSGVNLDSQYPCVVYRDENTAEPFTISVDVGNGNTKLQWKVDWAARWTLFDVDYEMHGKDLTDSYTASSQICRVLGGTPPLNMIYELFLDANGKKISKKLGNGTTLEQWFQYGSRDALAMYMFQSPKSAKKLTPEIIPRVSDELANFASRFKGPEDRDNPAWHVLAGRELPEVTYGLMLNLAQVSKASDPTVLLEYLEQYRPIADDQREAIEAMALHVINYARDHGLLDRETRDPTEQEALAFVDLACRFIAMSPGLSAENFQYQVYEVGKAHGFEPLRDWFKALYEVLLGESSGPRFGAFATAYGIEKTAQLLIDAAAKVVDVSGYNAIVKDQQETMLALSR